MAKIVVGEHRRRFGREETAYNLMERTQIFDLMGELKLFGMKSAYDDVMAAGIKCTS